MRSSTSMVVQAIRRHVVLILVVTIAFAAIGALVALTRSATYTSSASILLRPSVGNAFSSDSTASSQQVTIAVTTEAALANSTAVLDLANEDLPSDMQLEARQVSSSVPSTSQVIEVQVRAEEGEAAQRGAEAIADAILTYRQQQTTQALDSRLERLDEQEQTARKNLTEATDKGGPDSRQLITLYTEQLSSIDSARSSLLQAETSPGELIRPAEVPASPSGVRPIFFALIGTLLGLGLGLVLAVWRYRSDDRVHFESESVAGRPVLARLPATATTRYLDGEPQDTELVVGLRELRAAVLATAPMPASLLVTSSDGQENAPLVGLNLAASLAHADYTAALVMTAPFADLEPTLGRPTGPGLVEILETGAPVDRAVVRKRRLGVLHFAADPDAERRPDLYARAAFTGVVQRLKATYDYVIVVADSLENTGVLDVAMATDSLLITCTADHTRDELVTRSVLHANELGGEFLGAVVIASDRRRRRADAGARADAGGDDTGKGRPGTDGDTPIPMPAKSSDRPHSDAAQDDSKPGPDGRGDRQRPERSRFLGMTRGNR